jgi:hypothetical protein
VNKRVDIVVLPDVDSDTQQLLDDVAADTAAGGTGARTQDDTDTETGEASNDAGREIDHETVTRKDGDGDDNEHG